MRFEDDRIVARTEGPLSATVDGEAALLEPEEGVYYGLNAVGTRLWERLDSPSRVGELRRWLVETFEVDESTADADLRAFLGALDDAGLIEVRSAGDAA